MLLEQPVCANRSWTLYNNGGVASGYFCCLSGTTAYSVSDSSDGCADPDYQLTGDEYYLVTVAQPQEKPHHSSTGTIVGGIVGGTVAIILILLGVYIYRRRRLTKRPQASKSLVQPHQEVTLKETNPAEIYGSSAPVELPWTTEHFGDRGYVAELR